MPASRPSIATLLLVPVALLVALAVLLASALGYRYGEHAADDLVGQLVAESAAGLQTHLRGFLEKAQLATGVGATAMQQGTLEPAELFRQPEPGSAPSTACSLRWTTCTSPAATAPSRAWTRPTAACC